MFFFYNLIRSYQECTPVPDGLVINHYVLNNCAACQRFSPVVDEIKSKLNKASLNINYRKVVCNDCECEDIKSFPTIEITSDKSKVSKSSGYKNYNELSKWLTENLNIEKEVFEDHIAVENSGLVQLKAEDFLKGFDGLWFILFYEKYNDPLRKEFKKLALEYKDSINIGEVHYSEVSHVSTRFNIDFYPYMAAINQGTIVPYINEDVSYRALSEFSTKLKEPNFKRISYSELKEKAKEKKNGEPIYLLLYHSRAFDLASYYFNDLAQQFKFKIEMYRSDDPVVFEKAGFSPVEHSDEHEKILKLFVYKNGHFYPNKNTLEENDEIIQWIFHTHFPHLINIKNENFYSVFHGIKPVAILLHYNEQYLKDFNKIAADRHLGTPYSDILFASLELEKYTQFKNTVLKKAKTPSFVIFDPIKGTWYYNKNQNLTEKTLRSTILNDLEKYFENKLPEYTEKESRKTPYAVIALVIGILLYFLRKKIKKNKIE